ncbi:MAG: NUDIX domain-containing protein [Chloroflexi bacterium]|nr:NUDIX domain-containing protein [Chloroflexota bacterium]
MPNETPLGKVTAFVTRETRDGRQLLVFKHPSAGIQLPAGTIEPGEHPEDAVMREVREETGLGGGAGTVRLVQRLLTVEDLLAPDLRVLLAATPLATAPRPDAEFLSGDLARGLQLRVLETHHTYARVAYEIFITDNPAPLDVIRGWMPLTVLTRRVVRHLFHLRASPFTADRWTLRSDHGHEFAMRWVDLTTMPDLVPQHAEWLMLVRDRLRA